MIDGDTYDGADHADHDDDDYDHIDLDLPSFSQTTAMWVAQLTSLQAPARNITQSKPGLSAGFNGPQAANEKGEGYRERERERDRGG